MTLEERWPEIRRLFGAAFASSLHYSIATVGPDGAPHITPIGSVMLGEPGHGIYFEEFPTRLPQHLARDSRICVLAVNSSRRFWLGALLRGRFPTAPAVRLYGTAGIRRPATDAETARWQRRVRRVRFTKGHELLWRRMGTVRELHLADYATVDVGAMTAET